MRERSERSSSSIISIVSFPYSRSCSWIGLSLESRKCIIRICYFFSLRIRIFCETTEDIILILTNSMCTISDSMSIGSFFEPSESIIFPIADITRGITESYGTAHSIITITCYDISSTYILHIRYQISIGISITTSRSTQSIGDRLRYRSI